MFHSTCDAPGDKVAGDFAQAMSGAPFQAIGQIQTTSGSVTVTSASGAVVQANCGDFVCQHDTIETGADGNIGIIFNDGTAFNLSSNGRMVLSEFVYDPNGKSNSTLFSLSKGTFTFIPGKAAGASGLRIDTPVGRIRGSAREGGIGILTLAGLTFSVLDQIQAASQAPHGFLDDGAVTVANQSASRSHAFLDDDRLTYKHLPHGGYEITMRDGRVIMHDDPGETIQIDPSGTVTRIPNSSTRMADLQNFQQAALSTLSQAPQGAAPGGSSTDTFNAPLDLVPINFTRPENRAVQNQVTVTVNIAPTTSGVVEVVQLQPPPTPPTPPTPPPVLTADEGLHPITEVLNTTGSTKLDIAPSATLTFTDLNLSALSASLASITWSGGGTLPSGLSAVLASALSVAGDTAGTSGSITATFGAPDKDFDFLAANETLTVVYTVTVTDTNGVNVAQPVTITITGSNDPPFLAADASNSHTVVEGLATTRTLTFTDVDLTDHHAVSTSVTSATWSGGATLPSGLAAVLADALSTATTDSTGSGSGSIALTFSAAETAFDFLAAGQTLTVIYNVTVTDDGGVSSTQPVTITIIGTNDTPVITSTAQTGAVTEHTNVDNSGNLNIGGIITFTDVDLTDKHTVTFTAGDNNYLGTFTPTLTHDATGGSTGTVGWSFSVSDKAIEFLATGQTLTQTYTVQVADNNGGFTTQDVTITITGTNEAPVMAADVSGPHTITELAGKTGDTADLDTTSGTLTFTDVDLADTHQASASAPTFAWSAGTLTAAQEAALAAASTLALSEIDSTGSGVGSIAFSYSAADKTFDFLAAGQTLTVTYNVTVTDNIGVSSTTPVTITVTGNDDAPVAFNDAGSAIEAGGINNGTPGTNATGNVLTTTPTSTTPHASLAVSAIRTGADGGSGTAGTVGAALTGAHGTLTLNADGSYTYVVNNSDAAVQALNTGDTLTDTFTYTVNDPGGLTDTAQLTVTINGADDAPVAC